MRVDLLWFARLHEAAGCERTAIDLAQRTTSTDILAAATALLPACAGLIARSRVAVDCAFVDGPVELRDGSEIAIIPPVSGG
jgi:molybdopterin synthase sulfur carrier subunit